MKSFYEGTMLCWILSCFVLNLCDSKIIEITTCVLFILYNICVALVLYKTWREVKSIKQALLKNAMEICIALLPVLLFVIVHL